ncbi:MAG: hypothetical protein LAO20_18795 [Acidobacteriia bacterium]|nr:hypothetical protein [Terriglobia bacterium]
MDFRFESDLPLAGMKRALSVPGRHEWIFGDSEWHGDYLGGSITAEAVARIYPTKRQTLFHVSLRFVTGTGEPHAEAKLREAERALLDQVLPAIQARNAQPAEPLG